MPLRCLPKSERPGCDISHQLRRNASHWTGARLSSRRTFCSQLCVGSRTSRGISRPGRGTADASLSPRLLWAGGGDHVADGVDDDRGSDGRAVLHPGSLRHVRVRRCAKAAPFDVPSKPPRGLGAARCDPGRAHGTPARPARLARARLLGMAPACWLRSGVHERRYPRRTLIRILVVVALLPLVTACPPDLAPPPQNNGKCPPRPSCAEVVCELDQARGCEVCHCR